MMHQNKLISKLYKLKRKLFDKYNNDKNFHNLRYISYSIPLGCISVLLFGLVYGVVFVSDNKSDKVYAESITSSNSNASLTIAENDLHTTAAPGSIAYASTDISYSTTNVENYTLKISYAENHNSLKGDSADATNISDITNNTLTDNSWGYAWSNDNTITENNFSGLTYSSVPSYNNGNNLASGNTNISNGTGKLIFAAKFANNAVTTNYKTSVLLALAVTPKMNVFRLNYNLNGGSGGPTNLNIADSNNTYSYVIPTHVPSRNGYDFLGWSTIDYSTNTTTAVAGTNYLLGKTITLYANTTTNLYAVWRSQVATNAGFSNITNMQQMTSSICSNAVKGATKSLIDTRAGNYSYTVTKLVDGKCWMTQNLRLAGGTVLSSNDSNVNSNYTLPASTTGKFSYPDPELGQMSNSTNSNYGAYYSYNAATAGTMADASSGTSNYDICPRGWKLPSKDEYVALASALGINNDYAGSRVFQNTPNDFVLAGNMNSTTGNFASGSVGYYRSGTVANSYEAYILSFNLGTAPPDYSIGRFYGFSVRCIAK